MKLDLDALHGPALADAGLALPLFDVGKCVARPMIGRDGCILGQEICSVSISLG